MIDVVLIQVILVVHQMVVSVCKTWMSVNIFTSNSFGLYLFFSIISLCGCQPDDLIKITDAYLFNDKSFQQVLYLTAHTVNDDFVVNPVRLTQIDTILYMTDASLDPIVHKFDIKNCIYKGLGVYDLTAKMAY